MRENDKKPERNEFPCFWCRSPADRIGYFSKFYPEFNRGTRENPTLFCPICWDIHRHELSQSRGGMEGVFCITFESICKFPKKKIGWMLSKKGFEINHMANKLWRQRLWRIFYTHQNRRMIDDDSRPGIKVQNGVQPLNNTSRPEQEAPL